MKQYDRTIKDGDAGIRQTVQHMLRLIRRDASNAEVKAIARKLRAKNDEQTVFNTFKYVVDNFPYSFDPDDREVLVSPARHFECKNDKGSCDNKYGKSNDCDDLTMKLCCLLKANGYQTWIKIIEWKADQDGFSHVYAMCLVPTIDKVIPLDAVAKMKGFGWEKAPVRRSEIFKV